MKRDVGVTLEGEFASEKTKKVFQATQLWRPYGA